MKPMKKPTKKAVSRNRSKASIAAARAFMAKAAADHERRSQSKLDAVAEEIRERARTGESAVVVPAALVDRDHAIQNAKADVRNALVQAFVAEVSAMKDAGRAKQHESWVISRLTVMALFETLEYAFLPIECHAGQMRSEGRASNVWFSTEKNATTGAGGK